MLADSVTLADRGGWESDVVTSSGSPSVFAGFQLARTGTYTTLSDAVDYGELNALML